MKIKSLLLGSAAAVVAVTGARAADAIVVAEPEPIEYVRVCDAFGTGFFFIPGTETCLRFSGYMRYDIGFGDEGIGFGGLDEDGDGDESWRKRARLSFRTDTRTETELGTLRAYAEIRTQWDSDNNEPTRQGETEVTLNFGYIELAGFRVGKDESIYTTWTGYAGGLINDGLVPFGPFDVTLISYTYDFGNGFSIIGGVEDNQDNTNGPSRDPIVDDMGNVIDRGFDSNRNTNEYLPDFVAGASYDLGAWQFRGVMGYDSSDENASFKGRIDGSFGRVNGFIMGAVNTGNNPHFYAPYSGDWAIYGGLTFDATERFNLNGQASVDDDSNWGIGGNVVFTIVPGFFMVAEVDYVEPDEGSSSTGGVVRFQRNF